MQKRHYWMVKEESCDIDLCFFDPGFPVSLVITSGLATLTRVWMGDIEAEAAVRTQQVVLEGDSAVRMSFYDWIGYSPFVQLEADGMEPALQKSA
jgi:hypothetical protein